MGAAIWRINNVNSFYQNSFSFHFISGTSNPLLAYCSLRDSSDPRVLFELEYDARPGRYR